MSTYSLFSPSLQPPSDIQPHPAKQVWTGKEEWRGTHQAGTGGGLPDPKAPGMGCRLTIQGVPKVLSSEANGMLSGGLVWSDSCQHLGQGNMCPAQVKAKLFLRPSQYGG